MPRQDLCIISQPSVNSNSSYSLETPNLGQNWQFLVPCDLEIWRMTLKNNRVPLLSNIRLCASFHCHMWIQTGVTIWKGISGVMTFELWPWPFAWTSCLSMVITPEISGCNDNRNIVKKVWPTDRQTDGWTDRQKEVFLELIGHS